MSKYDTFATLYGDMLACLDADGWEGDDCSVTCPCGHRIDPDAELCPDGCVNPLTEMGMI